MRLLPPPGPERKKQLTYLAVLSVVVAGLAWYNFGRSAPGQATGQSPASKTQTPAAANQVVLSVPQPVKLETLDSVAEEPQPSRNPFKFGVKPTPPPPPPPPAPPPPVYTPPPPPPPPQVPLQLKTLIEWPDGRLGAMMVDPTTGAQNNVSEGSVFDGRYKIIKITKTAVTVSFLDGTGVRTIPFPRVGG